MRLVDVDALRKELDNHWPFTKEEQSKHGFADMAKSTVLFVLNKMPIIEERKRGEWINVTNDESLEEEYECSVCGYELFYSNPTKFCPNCGAKMMSEQIHELETELRDYENKGDDY